MVARPRDSRSVVACATGPLNEELIERAVTSTVARTRHRPLWWCSAGWQGDRSMLVRAYRKRVRTGKRGRPAGGGAETVTLTQTVKHRDAHGRLLSVEIRAALGAGMEPTSRVHVERLDGALRERINALTRKTHAFAKQRGPFRLSLVGLQFFDHNFHRAHRALRLPSEEGVRRYSSAVSGDGSGGGRSSLVVPRTVDHPHSYHP